MINTKNYIKIGLIISLICHIGIFALGGYVMDTLTKSLKNTQQISQQDDITYIETQENTNDTKEQTENISPPKSDIIINDNNSTDNTPIPEEKPKEEPPPKKDNISPQPPSDNLPQNTSHKLRKLSDLKNIRIGKITASPFQADNINLENSLDFQPKLISQAEPVYDYSLIPSGEEVHIILSYLLDDNGVPVQADIIRISETDLPPDVLEDLKTACIEALQKSKIEPPKDPAARNSPYQINFTLTSNGPVILKY